MYSLYTDGASKGNPGDAGIGYVIYQDNVELDSEYQYIGKKTNNEAEYIALIEGLKLCLKHKISEINIF